MHFKIHFCIDKQPKKIFLILANIIFIHTFKSQFIYTISIKYREEESIFAVKISLMCFVFSSSSNN